MSWDLLIIIILSLINYLWDQILWWQHYNLWYMMGWVNEIFLVRQYPITAFAMFYYQRLLFLIRNLLLRWAKYLIEFDWDNYLLISCKIIEDKSIDHWCFSYRLITQQYDFTFDYSCSLHKLIKIFFLNELKDCYLFVVWLLNYSKS